MRNRAFWGHWSYVFSPLVSLLVGLMLVSCGSAESDIGSEAGVAGSSTFEPTPTFIAGTVTPAIPITPEPEPTTEPYVLSDHDPLVWVMEPLVVREEDSAEAVLMQSPVVVEGKVVEILPSRWTTPDGVRPKEGRRVVPDLYTIVTPIILQLQGMPLVNLANDPVATDSVVLVLVGGKVGEDSLEFNDPRNAITLDEHILVAINAGHWQVTSGVGNFPTERGPGWWISHKWSITDDGNAVSYWSTRPFDELASELRNAAKDIGQPVESPTP